MSGERLADSSSAYLRQHATNPVNWFPWGDDAFAVAAREDRPVFLSIGYAACHWCHVMAHESFENDETAAVLNDHFVAIKVDREERPDVDAYYMAATQSMTGSGGWPMSVFLTPERRPFLAGTYFAPVAHHGQPGFRELLGAVADAWVHRRPDVLAQADQLATAVERELRFVDHLSPVASTAGWSATVDALVADLLDRADDRGGFSGAPKFPRPSYVETLLVRWDDVRARDVATHTLDAMSHGGIYDHLGGGFARYSVDADWRVPHFEKMLSDQALLALCYVRADRAAGGGTEWRDVALDTLAFVERDLRVPGGYASSLDADTVDGEGAHVTFTDTEVRDILRAAGLSDLVDDVLERWHIGPPGDLDGRSVPHLALDAPFATPARLRNAAAALLAARTTRPAPGRDDKVVLEWNAMLASALVETNDDALVDRGVKLLERLWRTHHDDLWWRTASHSALATCADVAWMIDAHVSAYEATGDEQVLSRAERAVADLIDTFWDGPVPSHEHPDQGHGVFTAAQRAGDLPTRGKEIFDGATPSAHAISATVLARGAMVTGDARAEAVARRLVAIAAPLLNEHPAAVPHLVRAYGYLDDPREIVVPGLPNALSDLVRSTFVPNSVLVTGAGSSPLLAARAVGAAYVCRARVCDAPAHDRATLARQLAALTER